MAIPLSHMLDSTTEGKFHETVQLHSLTLPRFLLAEQRKVPSASGEFSQLMYSILTAIKSIATAVRRTGLFNSWKTIDFDPADGEGIAQFAHDIFVKQLTMSYSVNTIISTSADRPIEVVPEYRGKYIVCIDPIDNPENVESCVPVGSVFGVHRKEDKEEGHLLPGNRLLASGYALYGCYCMIVLTLGQGLGVHGFTLNPNTSEFLLTDPLMLTPVSGRVYTIDEAQQNLWDATMTDYVNRKRDPKSGKFHHFRMTGSLVADVHRILNYGGTYLSPITLDATSGIVNLFCQSAPLAFLLQESGGMATSGSKPIIDIVPEHMRSTTPFYAGSRGDITDLLEIVAIDTAIR